MKASAMPAGEDLATLGRSGATLAIHLSIRNLKHVEAELTPLYGADCPVAVVYRASWPDQLIIRGTLADIRDKVRAAKITRTALILVGRVLGETDFIDSKLYDPSHVHVLRPKRSARECCRRRAIRFLLPGRRFSLSGPPWFHGGRDRKSTRLNSSH